MPYKYKELITLKCKECGKLYNCKECGKNFICLSLLGSHEQTHTGKRLLEYRHCEKAFSWPIYLYVRMQTG